jgi:hypothetical protein
MISIGGRSTDDEDESLWAPEGATAEYTVRKWCWTCMYTALYLLGPPWGAVVRPRTVMHTVAVPNGFTSTAVTIALCAVRATNVNKTCQERPPRVSVNSGLQTCRCINKFLPWRVPWELCTVAINTVSQQGSLGPRPGDVRLSTLSKSNPTSSKSPKCRSTPPVSCLPSQYVPLSKRSCSCPLLLLVLLFLLPTCCAAGGTGKERAQQVPNVKCK